MRSAPLTWRKLGSTRCVGCERLFTEDPRPIVETEATDYTGARPGYSASRPVKVMRRWHADCLAEFEAANQRYRDQVEADRQAVIAMLRADAANRQVGGESR